MLSFRNLTAVTMALMITHIPHWAAAEIIVRAQGQMVPTAAVVEELSRQQARERILRQIDRAEVRSELLKHGVSTQEVERRLAQLSDQELRDMSAQMDAAQYGGDVIGILVVVVLVLLIIYLAKRI